MITSLVLMLCIFARTRTYQNTNSWERALFTKWLVFVWGQANMQRVYLALNIRSQKLHSHTLLEFIVARKINMFYKIYNLKQPKFKLFSGVGMVSICILTFFGFINVKKSPEKFSKGMIGLEISFSNQKFSF